MKDVSKEFGMKANEFAEAIGYTTKAFYAALSTGDVTIIKANNTKLRREQVLTSLFWRVVSSQLLT